MNLSTITVACTVLYVALLMEKKLIELIFFRNSFDNAAMTGKKCRLQQFIFSIEWCVRLLPYFGLKFDFYGLGLTMKIVPFYSPFGKIIKLPYN